MTDLPIAFILIGCFTALLVILSVLPLTERTHWLIRVWDFPRLQLAGLGLLLLVTSAHWLPVTSPFTWLLVAIQVACCAWQLWWIFPYTPLGERTVERYNRKRDEKAVEEHLRILIVNVFEHNRNAVGLVRMINRIRPDIIVAVETDEWWEQQLTDIEDDLPHVVRVPQNNLYGMMVYSVWPLANVSVENLVQDKVPSVHADVQMPGGREIHLHCVHPVPPGPSDNDKSKPRDRALLKVAERAANEPGPVIVTGDLNDVAWSPTTREFLSTSKLLDPRMGRGFFNTFHAKLPLLRWPLDHLFHSEHFMLVKMRRLPKFGSDRFPLLIELALKKE
ncbi:endonuclease/exonuclease/phosphatase family protein [Pseudidiomarina terrestris]|uniref:endonuclease/exonuclease/phosphatase family protein n=1 Tax=Pseudidiomarina terrestris TaxID=2820060 RepID=UPI00264F7C95|nr:MULTISPECIES: endonuclease/exonuclease/phosphatase family protein [unclassified Pseudidiomarina]MDN7135881.1 endonuclease/exonuclease/phosphatase family protein [Pseudidiomarina sp. 1ASP75-5]MDN7138179.1 endonuclease/exonuclease/phosphatase family protein [Pseudidiomarina sp. 1ASP75-14]